LDNNWKRMRFKRNKVWMAVDSEERPVLENGKALIKYQLDQPHEYRVHPTSVLPLDHNPPDQDTRPASKKRPAKRPASNLRASVASPNAPDQSPEEQDALKAGAIAIYTDGACSGNPGPAGIGVVMLYKGHRKEISQYIGMATNNIAELKAIKVGLESVRNRDLPIVLYTDSSYSLGLLTKGWKAKQNQELVQKVRLLVNRFKNLHFVKIKGHAGHPENERADRLAVEAIQTGDAE
jgi:ribonuclease HI